MRATSSTRKSPLSGAISSALTLTNVQLSDGGSYSVRVTNLYGSVVSSNAVLTVNPVSPFTNCLNYANFASTSGLNLTGSAKATNGLLRLTPAVDGQIGNAWLSQKQTCAGGFDTSFYFRITQLGNTFGNEPGGDGITFTVQNVGPTNTVWAVSQPTNYVSVFFNTFWNWPGCGDYSICDLSDNSVASAPHSRR